MNEPRIKVEGNVIHVGRTRIHLRFLETFRDLGGGETEARVQVFCQGCQRFKTVGRVGLRHMGDGVIDLQPNCHECRSIMNARRADDVKEEVRRRRRRRLLQGEAES